jgi:hypothetical protein
MRRKRLILAAIVALSSLGLFAPAARAVECDQYVDGVSVRCCEDAEKINSIWRKLTGEDLVYCLQ